MSRRKQKKYEKEIRAQRAAQEKIDAEDARKAEREQKAEAARAAEKERRAKLSPEERSKEDKRNGIIGLVVVLVIVLFLFVACGGSSDKDEETAGTASSTTSSAPTISSSDEMTEAQGPSDEEKAAEYEAWLKDQFGGQDFRAILMDDPTLWVGYVNGFEANGDRMHVRLQIDRNDADAKEFAKRASNAIASLIRLGDDPRVNNVDWVVVDDGAGNYLAQTSV